MYYKNLDDVLKDVKDELSPDLYEVLEYWINEEKSKRFNEGVDEGYSEGYDAGYTDAEFE